MERRRFLVAVTGFSGVISGCTTQSTNSDSGGHSTADSVSSKKPTATETEKPTLTEEPTQNIKTIDAIEDAQKNLNEAIDLILEETRDAWSKTGDASLSTAGIEEALQNTHDSLETAERGAGTDQRRLIAEIRTYTNFIEQLLGVFVRIGDGLNEISTAVSYERSQRYQDAVEKLRIATSIFEKSQSEMSAAQATLDDLDEGLLGDINYAEARQAANELSNLLEGYHRLTAAGVHFDRGLENYSEAAEHYDAQNFDAAAFDFEAAGRQFGLAEDRYRQAEDEVTQSFKSAFITQTCHAERLKEASNLWADASEEFESGHYTDGRRSAQEASTVMDRTCG